MGWGYPRSGKVANGNRGAEVGMVVAWGVVLGGRAAGERTGVDHGRTVT